MICFFLPSTEGQQKLLRHIPSNYILATLDVNFYHLYKCDFALEN